MEQCGEVIVHTAFPLPFLLSVCLSLSLSLPLSPAQYSNPQHAAQYSGGDSLPSVFKPPQPQGNDFS